MLNEDKAVRQKIKQAIKLILCINLPRSLSDILTTVLVLVGFSPAVSVKALAKKALENNQ